MIVPVFHLPAVAESWAKDRESKAGLARRYDGLRRYMYLPPLEDEDEEWLADLSRITSISLKILTRLADNRLTQLTMVAAQQLQFKLVLAATSVFTDRAVYRPSME